MNKAGKIYGIVSGLLALILIATVVLFCIPQTQAKMADWTAKFSPEHQKVLDDNKELMSSIEKLNGEISTKTQLIKDKDNEISGLKVNLADVQQQAYTLTTQKTALLSVVTEIDNKINSTTDATEIDNLEERKASILAQIDALNEEIETLEQEKTQLEADIAVLQQEKATLEEEVKKLKQEKVDLEKQVQDLEKDNENLLKQKGAQLVKNVTYLELPFGDIKKRVACVESFEEYLNILKVPSAPNIREKYSSQVSKYYLTLLFETLSNNETYTARKFKNETYEIRLYDIYTGGVTNQYLDEVTYNSSSILVKYNGEIISASEFENIRYEDLVSFNCYASNFTNDGFTLNIVDLTGVYKMNNNCYVDFDNLKMCFGGSVSDITGYELNWYANTEKPSLYIFTNGGPYEGYFDYDQDIKIDENCFIKVDSLDTALLYTYTLYEDCYCFLDEYTEVSFISNGQTFNNIRYDSTSTCMYYGDILVYNGSTGEGWVDEAYKKVIFSEFPSDDICNTFLMSATLEISKAN